MALKICNVCELALPLEDFVGKKKKRGVCKPCHAKRNREWRAENPEYMERYNKEYMGTSPIRTVSKKVLAERRERAKETRKRLWKRRRKVYAAYRPVFEEEHPDNGITYYEDRIKKVYNLYKERYEREIGPL